MDFPCMTIGWGQVILLLLGLICAIVSMVSPDLGGLCYGIGGLVVLGLIVSTWFRDCRGKYFMGEFSHLNGHDADRVARAEDSE